jgi:hypothetical protein
VATISLVGVANWGNNLSHSFVACKLGTRVIAVVQAASDTVSRSALKRRG